MLLYFIYSSILIFYPANNYKLDGGWMLQILLTDLACPPPSIQVETLTCESRQSNPAPRLRWYLGDRELQGEQSDATEAGDERRWRSTNALRHKFAKDDFGKSLACKVEHPAYSTGVRMATVLLDVLCECYAVHLFQSFSAHVCGLKK